MLVIERKRSIVSILYSIHRLDVKPVSHTNISVNLMSTSDNLLTTQATLPAVYSLAFSNQRCIQRSRVRSVITSKTIKQFLILESVVIAHYRGEDTTLNLKSPIRVININLIASVQPYGSTHPITNIFIL